MASGIVMPEWWSNRRHFQVGVVVKHLGVGAGINICSNVGVAADVGISPEPEHRGEEGGKAKLSVRGAPTRRRRGRIGQAARPHVPVSVSHETVNVNNADPR
jgi:hypothetical protein